ncbi:RNA-directed DNA polymerase from mobile element jockey [Plakobranchus ocellatus]|uniref:RNA-directed DNA polymerase from mobile element jockey n=1 Tax=Plakobranchus ocellatus TaxID=259542 RepID=A0AAV3Y1Y8_9GAST|nr:RNA-directed DNA polymerase from mobile element jockey [Plakobranchus ocellatus]
MHDGETKSNSRTYTTFLQRLVGLEDHELKPTVSPYTTRNDPSWQPPPSPPIDFCYVRPEHIPSVNALCREFFWPGIDMSECLQYPDFSCVVLYRKIVIAFAFMVPDRGYNEAYISFIFTHPEWRGAGIATFMLYHLIQTCMGKDVLLHVSATNPAMLLYQKFGFKSQELILNFYHKYFPFDCKDSNHAFLMRLTR